MAQLRRNLIVYLPDTRAVEVSRYGRGNLKIGADVFTYSRLPGGAVGTCPGASDECERICYAKRIGGVVRDLYVTNSDTDDVPEIPDDCQTLRIHVSGDFNTAAYIENWIGRLSARPDVQCWAYTRSWRVPSLLPALERLRGLPNVQLFASMDQSIDEAPPDGWRRAWIDGDPRAGMTLNDLAHVADLDASERSQRTFDGVPTLVCPEETKHKANCEDCGYCFRGHRNDVTFLRH